MVSIVFFSACTTKEPNQNFEGNTPLDSLEYLNTCEMITVRDPQDLSILYVVADKNEEIEAIVNKITNKKGKKYDGKQITSSNLYELKFIGFKVDGGKYDEWATYDYNNEILILPNNYTNIDTNVLFIPLDGSFKEKLKTAIQEKKKTIKNKIADPRIFSTTNNQSLKLLPRP